MSEPQETRKPSKLKLTYIVTAVAISCLMVGASLGIIIKATTPGFPTVIEPGSMVSGASYVVFKDGTTYYAKNGTTGAIDYSDSNARVLLQEVSDFLGATNSAGTVYLKIGNYDIDQTLNWNAKVSLIGESFIGCENRVPKMRATVTMTTDTPLINISGGSESYYAGTFENIYFQNPYYATNNIDGIKLYAAGLDMITKFKVERCAFNWLQTSIHLQGFVYGGIWRDCEIWATGAGGANYTTPDVLLDNRGISPEYPKENLFDRLYVDGNSDRTAAISIEQGDYNRFDNLLIDSPTGHFTEAVIKINNGSSNIFRDVYMMDLAAIAGFKGSIYLTSANCFGNQIDGQIARLSAVGVSGALPSVVIDDGAFRNYIGIIPFGTACSPMINSTGAGIDNMVEIFPPHMASGTAMTITHVGTDVIFRGYGCQNSGTANITGAFSTVTVNHGLATTPTIVVVTVNNTGAGNYSVSSITLTQFVITFTNQPATSEWLFYWYAEV